ncbi:MAG: hypothetical protein JKY56_24360, partial [Kofleriaceae bacterium]|nr:hypothetical protein [Kofleriaceae bacterium]
MTEANPEGTSMPQVGDVLSRRYEILSHVGSCPTRRTYLAFDRDVEVEVTLWWVPGYLFADEMARELFEHNIAAMRKIKSPHLLRLFDFAQLKEPDGFYITLQLGSSKGFEALLLSGVGAEDETFMRFARGLSAGIEAAYQQGFYHAWLSPADLVEVSGQVKVAGIGLFAGLQSSRVLRHWLEEVPSEELRYIAPEILAGDDGSPASDIYAMA